MGIYGQDFDPPAPGRIIDPELLELDAFFDYALQVAGGGRWHPDSLPPSLFGMSGQTDHKCPPILPIFDKISAILRRCFSACSGVRSG